MVASFVKGRHRDPFRVVKVTLFGENQRFRSLCKHDCDR
jgi:hypothetical protein